MRVKRHAYKLLCKLAMAHRVLVGHLTKGHRFSRLLYPDVSKTRKHLLHLRFSKKAVL